MMTRTLATVVLAVGLGLTGCGGDNGTQAPGQPAASQASASPSQQAAPAKCEKYPARLATSLVTDAATGKTRVPGPVGDAVFVKSKTVRPDGLTAYAIAVNVGDKAVVVAHPVAAGEGPEAAGPFSPVNPFSAQATGLEIDHAAQVGVKQAVLAARDCVL